MTGDVRMCKELEARSDPSAAAQILNVLLAKFAEKIPTVYAEGSNFMHLYAHQATLAYIFTWAYFVHAWA